MRNVWLANHTPARVTAIPICDSRKWARFRRDHHYAQFAYDAVGVQLSLFRKGHPPPHHRMGARHLNITGRMPYKPY